MVQPAGAWDEIVDVVVVGSGGGALTAALLASTGGASVLVIEKDDVIGGTTGVSGGVAWVPNNHLLGPAGYDDSRQDAIDYIVRIADGREIDRSLIDVFVDQAPEMLRYVEDHTKLEFQIVTTLPDYYGPIIDRIPGCKPFSRSVEPKPFDAREALGEFADRVAARSTLLSLGASTTLVEDQGGGVDFDELARREREGVRVKGGALVSGLLAAVLDVGAEVRTATPADELVVDDRRAVVGVIANGARIGARQGVVLGAGGFEWNPEMVRAYLGYEVKPISPGANTGDAHRMAMEVGAEMGNMTSYWGQGAMYDPAITDARGEPAPQMASGLGPGSIMVNQRGVRFMHGGITYNDFPKAFGNFDQRYPGLANQPPAWVIFGPSVKEARPILTMQPGEPAPSWLVQAPTLRELAGKIGVDPDTLEHTVATYNGFVEAGEDPEWGDPTQTHTLTGYNQTMAKVEGQPFYAIQQWPGTLGTNGGCRIDANGQVHGTRTPRIEGLYAVGNTSATVLGGAYLGGGTPIASGMTFGYLAGRHVASQARRDLGETG
ncbi:MAG TPA: FAD-dependent oxidoreductase [Ilumatobacter sp.]|nr:FAD-dependent oxidoreductase [Ilumatobacter sp.]